MSAEFEIPGPELSYTEMMDEAISAQPDRKDFFPLRPSASGYCGRKLAYDLMQFKGLATYPIEEKKPEIRRLLNLGSNIEYHELKNLDLLKDSEYKIASRYKQQTMEMFRLADGQLIEGSVDVVTILPDGTAGIGDVKSAKDKFSQGFKTDWDERIDKFNNMATLIKIGETGWYAPNLSNFLKELNDPFLADNFYQVNSYCCTEFAKNHKVTHGFILRYCKNDSRHIEIRFKPELKLYKEVQNKFEAVSKAVAQENPELVKKDYNLGSIRCAFCPYKNECWSEDALKAYFKTFPKKEWPVDIFKTDPSLNLQGMFDAFEANRKTEKEISLEEESLVKVLVDNQINKIKLDNGHIYEVKYLKSPRPHFELRRGKI